METEKQVVLDLLDTNSPALSSTDDVPKVETKPDATPAKEEVVPAAPEKAETETSATSDKPEDSSATPEEAKKPAKGVQKRIDELTRQREDERRAREAAEARELRILAALEKATGVTEKPKDTDTEPVRPQESAFQNPQEYDAAVENWIAARSEWIADRKVAQKFEEQNRRTAEERQAAQVKKVQEDFQKRVDKAKEKYADFSEVAESPDVMVSFPMSYAILNAEEGPEIQYFLGKNPAEAKRISEMNIVDHNGNTVPDVARQLVELGKIVNKLTIPTRPVSAAPAPIKPISKASEHEKSAEEESMEEYAARRKKELNSVRPGVRH